MFSGLPNHHVLPNDIHFQLQRRAQEQQQQQQQQQQQHSQQQQQQHQVIKYEVKTNYTRIFHFLITSSKYEAGVKF